MNAITPITADKASANAITPITADKASAIVEAVRS
jgi:hypothetical protein